jgi:hypothetical protein
MVLYLLVEVMVRSIEIFLALHFPTFDLHHFVRTSNIPFEVARKFHHSKLGFTVVVVFTFVLCLRLITNLLNYLFQLYCLLDYKIVFCFIIQDVPKFVQSVVTKLQNLLWGRTAKFQLVYLAFKLMECLFGFTHNLLFLFTFHFYIYVVCKKLFQF